MSEHLLRTFGTVAGFYGLTMPLLPLGGTSLLVLTSDTSPFIFVCGSKGTAFTIAASTLVNTGEFSTIELSFLL